MQTESIKPVRMTRAQQQAVTRQRLLTAAESTFSRLGYGGASVDVISAEAGLSKGAVYSNFETKEELFLELLRMYMERDMAELERIVSLEPEKLYKAFARWLATMHSDTDCPVLITELQLQARRSPEFAVHYYALQEQLTAKLAHILQLYFDASSVKLPMAASDLAESITALAHGLSLQRPTAKTRSRNHAGRIIDELLKILLGA